MDFDFNSEFIKKYFGADKKRSINYHAFCQLLHDFYEEQGQQAFKRYDKKGEGVISSLDFQHIMKTVKGHLLTEFVSYPYYAAFNSLLAKMELIKRVYLSLARGNLDLELTKEEFLQATQSYAQITPYEIYLYFFILIHSPALSISNAYVRISGLLGLYRGLLPQIVGVAPEKAIKLTMNDFVRDKFTKEGKIPFWAEVLAGGCAGGSQVIFTNPLEIVKIRLQVAGEIQSAQKVCFLTTFATYSPCSFLFVVMAYLVRFKYSRGIVKRGPTANLCKSWLLGKVASVIIQ
ncbi:unnamed protein product [Haemonchus placei]|uniref:EF-hand domain-containing protein n=1 Tax=Haemonchus placei TaxID=6290 RepID=A0A0N4XAD2_HAEPC|nr:unnamed protein product [Haemonchus placei]